MYKIFRIKVAVTIFLELLIAWFFYVAGVIFGQSFNPWLWPDNARGGIVICYVFSSLMVLAFMWVQTENREKP